MVFYLGPADVLDESLTILVDLVLGGLVIGEGSQTEYLDVYVLAELDLGEGDYENAASRSAQAATEARRIGLREASWIADIIGARALDQSGNKIEALSRYLDAARDIDAFSVSSVGPDVGDNITRDGDIVIMRWAS